MLSLRPALFQSGCSFSDATLRRNPLWPEADGPAGRPYPGKSIAVLPFENRSEDKANAFFADGIQDEILTRLAKIGMGNADCRIRNADWKWDLCGVRATIYTPTQK